MKRVLFAVAVLFEAAAYPAGAADLTLPTKAPPMPAPAQMYSWTGFYAGGNAGYSWGTPDSDTTLTGFAGPGSSFVHSDPLKFTGAVGGAQIGYNWQTSNPWVLSFETDWQASTEKASLGYGDPYLNFPVGSGTAAANYEAKILWFGTVRGRVGYAWDRLMIYGTGGLAYGDVKVSGTTMNSGFAIPGGPYSGTAPFSASKVNAGWTIGAGIEGALVTNWSWKVEYLYVDLGSLSVSPPGPFALDIVAVQSRFTDNIVRAGLNFQFH
jgi:outer membrane immunogenic protein